MQRTRRLELEIELNRLASEQPENADLLREAAGAVSFNPMADLERALDETRSREISNYSLYFLEKAKVARLQDTIKLYKKMMKERAAEAARP
jgi:enolase